LHNWVDEYKKFAPDVSGFKRSYMASFIFIPFQIPVVMYHGTPAERAELRRTAMALPGTRQTAHSKPKPVKKAPTKRKVGRPSKVKKAADSEPISNGPRRSGRTRKSTIVLESDDEEEEEEKEDPSMDAEDEETSAQPEVAEYTAKFPVILTTYEMIIKDRAHLSHYNWGYIVVDEGHRLKNLDCKLMKEIKRYSSAGRMILTGTPLHVCF